MSGRTGGDKIQGLGLVRPRLASLGAGRPRPASLRNIGIDLGIVRFRVGAAVAFSFRCGPAEGRPRCGTRYYT